MIRNASLAAACLSAVCLAALATPTHAAEQAFMVNDFDGVVAAGSHKIIVTTGKSPSVRAVGERDDLDRLKIEVAGRTLRVGQKSDDSWLSWNKSEPVTIYVTTHELTAAKLVGSGDMSVDRMNGRSVGISIAGSGDLNVGVVKASDVNISIAGSGDLTMTGTCENAAVSVAGSGNVEAVGLKCQNLTGKVAGSGNIKADVAKSATLKVAGSGDILVTGKAKCDVHTTGSGRVRCGDDAS